MCVSVCVCVCVWGGGGVGGLTNHPIFYLCTVCNNWLVNRTANKHIKRAKDQPNFVNMLKQYYEKVSYFLISCVCVCLCMCV